MDSATSYESCDVPQSLYQDVMGRSAVASTHAGQLPGHQQSPSMDELVHRFLNNTKLRFGDHSFEVNAINGILSSFRNAEISKRDALSSITVTLRNQDDLKQDLMNVLCHKDASWAIGDFDFDQPVTQACPQFLQPVHEPQIRLPPIPSPWYSNHQTVPSINPAVLSSYSGLDNFGHQEHREPDYMYHGDSWPLSARVPAPMSQMPSNFYLPNQFTSPTISYSTKFPPYTSARHGTDRSPTCHRFGSTMQQSLAQGPWEGTDYSSSWAATEPHQPPKRAQSLVSNQFHSPAPSYDRVSPSRASPTEELLSDASPSVLGNHFAVPIGRPAIDMPPPPKKRNRRASAARIKAEEQASEDDAQHHSCSSPSTAVTTQQIASHHPNRKQSNTKATRTRSEGGLFIHSICGKGFASRAKVKKHHWGAKNDDLETTTGCWVKHERPNMSWDEHPSCREVLPAPRAAKRTPSQPMAKQKESDHKAPMVPAMIPRHNTIPSFPTLHSLPQTVADVLTPGTLDHRIFEDVGPYHSHRLPARGNFDSLLTAVNIASRIDAPKPQGRNDSVVSHLDAQAVAAERNGLQFPAWADSSRGRNDYGFAYSHPAGIVNGLGISYSNSDMQVPLGMVLPSQNENIEHGSSLSPTDTSSSNDRTFNPSKRDGTSFGSSASSDPTTKRQKV